MLIADDLAALLVRDELNRIILGMFAGGMADYEIVDALPGVTLTDLVTTLVSAHALTRRLITSRSPTSRRLVPAEYR